MKKKLLAILAIGAVLLCGCSENEQNMEQMPKENGKYSIVTSSFHEYDWVEQIIGENSEVFDLELLMDDGTDLHSYEPTFDDIVLASSSNIFIYNGGASDTWSEDIIKQAKNSAMQTICISDVLGDRVKDEVMVDGMQETEHSHDHDHGFFSTIWSFFTGGHDHSHADEHVWLSIQNAMIACEKIKDEIVILDPQNADNYNENLEKYITLLTELDDEYKETIENASRDTLIFADRFPFLYMMEDYGINYYAAFSGCSAETEASFETVVFLANKTDELDVNNVLIIDNGLEKLATTIIENSQNKDCDILTLNSMQSVNRDDIENGASYYLIMKENLEIIAKSLAD